MRINGKVSLQQNMDCMTGVCYNKLSLQQNMDLYGLNPLTPIYLLTMSNIFVLKHKDTQASFGFNFKRRE